MNSASIAESIFGSFPPDPEDPARALSFNAFVRASDFSTEGPHSARCLYHQVANGTLQLHSLADVNMMVYGLRENLPLVEYVAADVERILARYGVRGGELGAWNYIRRCAEAASATGRG